MNSYFATEKTILFGDLTGGRMAKHGVGVIIDKTEAGEPFSAKLLYGMSIVLVRADQSGVVTDFQPVQINDEDAPYIGAAIQYEFDTVLEPAD
jgi:hypothetical protein